MSDPDCLDGPAEQTPVGSTPVAAFRIRQLPAAQADLAPMSALPRAAPEQRRYQHLLVGLSIFIVIGTGLRIYASGARGGGLVILVVADVAVFGGCAVASLAAASTAMRRRASLNSMTGRNWLWSPCTFLGPYDDERGLAGSRGFFALHERSRRAPIVGLLLLNHEFVVVSNVVSLALPGHGLSCQVTDLAVVDIIAGVAPDRWLSAGVWRRSGWRVGQVRLTTTDGRQAMFTGVRVDYLASRLQSLGGEIALGC